SSAGRPLPKYSKSSYALCNSPVLQRPVELAQFRSRKFVAVLARHSMIGSMGRAGAAGDNAAMESFFALLQKNVLDRRTWATRQELRIAIVTWIERTYHRRRRQKRLARLTRVEYETIMTPPAALAA
ncbi:IS3 family transposase, partial [Streptomyces microflavus]|uniref:IS3 family transposase n=1 Tax=Streptomyces microflavus TaxID=1919 RepID=UPI003F4CA1A3